MKKRKALSLLLTAGIAIFGLATPEASAKDIPGVHTVKPGESLWSISRVHQTSVQQLMNINGLQSTVIYPGQKLALPLESGRLYTVVAGDTLWLIGKRFGVTPHDIKIANHLHSDVIYAGQVLLIPWRSYPSTFAPPSTLQAATVRYTAEEVDLLARLVTAEAEGEPYLGQVAVAAVVLNRVKSPQFPDSITGVIYETYEGGKIYAFSPVQNGRIYRPATASAKQAVWEALGGADPTNGALYFYNPVASTSRWITTRTVATRIGNHVFAY